MDRKESEIKAKHLDEQLHRIANMMGRIEKIPRNYGTPFTLHPSEIRTIRTIGRNPGINATELAAKQGVTKGAVSQVLSKLEKKKLIIRMKEIDNHKTIFLKLSEQGGMVFERQRAFHTRMHAPLADLMAAASPEETAFAGKLLRVVETFCEQALNQP